MEKEDKALSDERPTILKHYPQEFRESMLGLKQDFASFLLSLHHMKRKDYALLATHVKNGEIYGYLFLEWLFGNRDVFTEKELRYCPKLREPAFRHQLSSYVGSPLLSKLLVPFVVSYYMVK